jgi:hypothetical protein
VEFTAYAPQWVELVKGDATALGQLALPGTKSRLAKQLLALSRKAVKAGARLTAGLAVGDTVEVQAAIAAFERIATARAVVSRDLGVRACGKDVFAKPAGSPAAKLERELQSHPAVVVVFYSPASPVDGLATREARAGAAEAGAGFVAVDVTDEGEVATLSERYAVREAPAVLVVVPLQGAVTRLDGFADRSTVAQAAENATS